ncbi:MAG: competence/damage-inducible protein A [Proteobacteria bacterium]|nr:competence/damage-inducible protein A [Pseudomonadota bacterium]
MTVRQLYPGTYSASIVIIGNEILGGRTQDTNTPWMAERLAGNGVVVGEVRIVPDDKERIVRAVKELSAEFEYVFTTGGIGPTHDDVTAESMAEAFGAPLEKNVEAYSMLEKHYGPEGMNPSRAKMSMMPHGAKLIPNPVTAAPGFIVENVYVMAGVPRIMQAMMDYLMDNIPPGSPILSNAVACTLRESIIADDLTALQKKYSGIQIGSYPHFRSGNMGLSLVLRGTDQRTLEQATDELIKIIRTHGDEPRAMSMRTHDTL